MAPGGRELEYFDDVDYVGGFDGRTRKQKEKKRKKNIAKEDNKSEPPTLSTEEFNELLRSKGIEVKGDESAQTREDQQREVVESDESPQADKSEYVTETEKTSLGNERTAEAIHKASGLPEILSTTQGEKLTKVLGLDLVRRILNAGEEETITIDGVETKITLDLLNNIEGEPGENMENFRKLVQYFWKDLAVHGVFEEDRSQEMVNGKYPMKLVKKSDLDGNVCRLLFKEVGIKDEVQFVSPGTEVSGGLTLDSSKTKEFVTKEGERIEVDGVTTIFEEKIIDGVKRMVVTTIIDHHNRHTKSDTSTSQFVYDGLVGLGLLKAREGLTRLVEITTFADNGIPPREMEYVWVEYNKKNGTNLSRREFMLQKWSDTVWSLKHYIQLPNLLSFLEKGGDPTKIIDENSNEFRKLGVIYKREEKNDKGEKVKVMVDNREKFHDNLESSLAALQEIEKAGKILMTKYGRIVVDEGGKMGGLGSQMCRDLGYDGYISYKGGENSFMVWTRKPLEEDFGQGFNVREFMWVKKADDGKEVMSLDEICKKLSGKKKLEWSSGLMLEAINIGEEEKKEVAEPEKVNEKSENSEEGPVWYEGIEKDLEKLTSLDEKFGLEERRNLASQMRERGVNLPRMSIDPNESELYANRIRLRAATEYLTGDTISEDAKNVFPTRELAMKHLSGLGIKEDMASGGTDESINVGVGESEGVLDGSELVAEVLEKYKEIPVKDGEKLRPFPGLKVFVTLIKYPSYRESDRFPGMRSRLEDAGVDVASVLGEGAG